MAFISFGSSFENSKFIPQSIASIVLSEIYLISEIFLHPVSIAAVFVSGNLNISFVFPRFEILPVSITIILSQSLYTSSLECETNIALPSKSSKICAISSCI